jgi:predicted metal-dependent peptidase
MIYHKFLEQTIGILIDSYPFFGCLVQRCSINWTDAMPTAAVRVLPSGSLEMVVNPEFFCQLTPKERVGLVLHEMYHLTCDHMSLSFGLDPQIANIAMDTSINQHIPIDYLPPGALLPDNVVHLENRQRKQQGEAEIKLQPMESFANYYNILKAEFDRQHIQQMQNPHQMDGALDANNQRKHQTPEEQKKQQEQVKKSLQELLAKEQELEQEKQTLMTKPNLSSEEKQVLSEVIELQKELINSQKEIGEALKKMNDQEITELNNVVTSELVKGQEKVEAVG